MVMLYLFLQSLIGTAATIATSYLLMYNRSDFKALAEKMTASYEALDKIDSYAIVTAARRTQKDQIRKQLEVSSAKLTRMRWTSWIASYLASTIILRVFNKLIPKQPDSIGGYLPFYFPTSIPPFNRVLRAGLTENHDSRAISTQIIVLLLNQAMRPALLKLAKCELPAQVLPHNAGKAMFGGTFMVPTEEVTVFT